jgi:iron complex outermembrane receptor protein
MRLSTEGKLKLAAKMAFVAGFGVVANSAFAQEATTPAPAADDTSSDTVKLDALQVTGSRIKQPNLTSTASMTILSDEELKYQGTTNIETLLNSLPQVFAEYSNNDSNGATGTATVNLRGLGSNRTLVLIDGRRLMGGDPFIDNSADLNFIPPALVDRVEVLSGGASAVYGADAVAGVVNFKMKRDFDGFRLDAQGSGTDQGDGWTRDVTGIWGANSADGTGNVTLYATYAKQDKITQNMRKFSECSITTVASVTGGTGDTHICAGSGTIPEGRFISYDRYYAGLDYYAITNPNGTRSFIEDDGRTYNFAPFNYFQRPTDRYNIGGFAHKEINKHFDLYVDAMYMDSHTVAAVAPSGLFGDIASVPCTSPLLSASQKQFLCDEAGLTDADSATVAVLKRSVELGPRISDLRHEQSRIVLGSKGEIADDWTYDFSMQRGQVVYSAGTLNYIDIDHAQRALTTTVDGDGNAVCADAQAISQGCVPLDLFQLGALTPEQLAYISADGYEQATQIQQVVTGSISGDLGKYGVISPFAKTGVSVAFGAEYRSEELTYRPDGQVESGNLGGTGGPRPPVSGKYSVHDYFGELQLPILEDQTFAKLLLIDGAYRHSEYTTSGGTDAYKAGMQWAPTSDVALRYSFQKAVRSPAITELFQPQQYGLFGGSDPCAGKNLGTPNAPTLEQCMNTGVTEKQYNDRTIRDCSSGQCNGLFSGTDDLKPEESITRSYGIVLTPTFVKNLTLTVDYFDITVSDAIAAFDPNVTMRNCLQTGDQASCSLIHRGPTGIIWGSTDGDVNYIEARNANTSFFRTKGFDIEGNYKFKLIDVGAPELGVVAFNYVGTILDSFESEQTAGAGTYDCAGLYGLTCGTPNPEYRHKFRITWGLPIGLNVSAAWRYFGEAELDTNESNPVLSNGRQNSIDAKLKAKNYLDLSGNYLLPIPNQSITVRFGVNNVTETKPQVVSSGGTWPVSSPPYGNGNTFPNVYDTLGRNFFVGLTADF